MWTASSENPLILHSSIVFPAVLAYNFFWLLNSHMMVGLQLDSRVMWQQMQSVGLSMPSGFTGNTFCLGFA